VLSDGDAGLRMVQLEVAPNSEHVHDWFHIAMRFEHLFDAARAIRNVPLAAHVSAWAHNLATRAKWALWNGQADKTLASTPGSSAALDARRAMAHTRSIQAASTHH
jgi:hypothetical protein